ncbi:MAG: fused MFS/spermidine synthase [Deltaproteobacteria bacterium]|nr:fused MFS/spermidine synthase [Deltaproteobacteria bacterium]
MGTRAWKIATLLFGSGFCALVYQIAWMREFRLVFGASTAASAAVVAIFIGGLGLGGLLLGRRADRHPRPLLLYARLELGIALSAAVSPGLLWLVRLAYIQLGGSATLGLGLATAIRLVLSALVLLVPTFLMGGTLPAASRAVETEEDANRRGVGLLYGVNTLGSVAGCLLANFLLLEVFGDRRSLWMACLVNLLVAVIARKLSRRDEPMLGGARAPAAPREAIAPSGFVLPAAAVVGFAFFLMELVWYRMLGPLLGGTIFTFGLILAVALLGIGLGGAAYSAFARRRPATLLGFASTCLLEAAFIALPFAAGDRVAILALALRPLGSLGMSGHMLGWSLVAFLVVLPAAAIAGFQFPMLIALLGRGREDVGRQVGQTYAWNTAGAIAGSLAGGFGLLPLLGAPGCWLAVAVLLTALGVAALALAWWRDRPGLRLLPPAAVAVIAALLCLPEGPTAVWRHSPIGAGRISTQIATSPNGLRDWANEQRRTIAWEAEGVESSVAMQIKDGLAFVINGKVDGNAIADASTQVMSGMLGACLHPQVRSAMVIGLGTGSTAGWLGAIPSIERVDVVELEPAILEVARACTPVNRDVMHNPKVHISIGDAREVLLTTFRKYDLVFSEPSNPYRAGIASLFTREYYQSIAERLEDGGLFVQWVQGYEVDARTVRTIYATLASVFDSIETWRVQRSDLLLIASARPLAYDRAHLQRRLRQQPYRAAMESVWRVVDVEGILGRFAASSSLASAVAAREGDWLNTDDHNHVEFGFAAAVGQKKRFSVEDIIDAARRLGADRPSGIDAGVDWSRVIEARQAVSLIEGAARLSRRLGRPDPPARHRLAALRFYVQGQHAAALAAWRAQAREPASPTELVVVADSTAAAGDDSALAYIELLRAFQPAEADAVLARLRLAQGRLIESTEALASTFEGLRCRPWQMKQLMQASLALAEQIARRDPSLGRRLAGALDAPFSVYGLEEPRKQTLVRIASLLELDEDCARLLSRFEPEVYWRRGFLRYRLACYASRSHPLAEQAAEDLGAFLRDEPVRFGFDLVPRPAGDPD